MRELVTRTPNPKKFKKIKFSLSFTINYYTICWEITTLLSCVYYLNLILFSYGLVWFGINIWIIFCLDWVRRSITFNFSHFVGVCFQQSLVLRGRWRNIFLKELSWSRLEIRLCQYMNGLKLGCVLHIVVCFFI